MGADSVLDRLGEITAPAVLLHGSADVPIPPEAGAALAVRLLDGVAHTPPVTAAARTGAALAAFLPRP
jgi:3-oxoadipate enol-lactonase